MVEELWHKPANENRDLLRLSCCLDPVLLIVVQQEDGKSYQPRLARERGMEEGLQGFDNFFICRPTVADDPQGHEHLAE